MILRLTRLALASRRRAFLRALDHCRASQDAVLRDIVRRTSRTEYGRAHRVDPRDGYAAFAAKLPVVTYDDLQPWIDRQIAAEDRQLVDEPVLFYERTSGSTAASKLIPCTRALRRSFHRMFLVWLEDLLRNGPRLERGTLYISASPLREGGRTARGVPIGSQSDVDFLERGFAKLLRRFLVPLDANPEVVSVWNASVLHGIAPMPDVKLVSCWAAGAESLRETFPNAVIQYKGLLATEAPITIPLWGTGNPACPDRQDCLSSTFVPLLDEVFLELEDAQARIHRLDEVTIGEEYALVISQKAGLVRYRLGDRIRVTHAYRNAPCLAFLGRDGVSDLAGEKLSEGFAREVLSLVTGGRFGVLLPERDRYLAIAERGDAETIAHSVEEQLQRSYRYAEARQLGQLAPVCAAVVPDASTRWLEYFESKGMRRGDIKPAALVIDRADARALAEILHASTVQ